MHNIYDLAELKNRKPLHAEGHPCIMLTDPLTGKVKEKIEGENHVFTGSLLSMGPSSVTWPQTVTDSYLCLNDNNADIDPNFPYLLGQTVGFGYRTTAGTGLFQGAYNAANQVLARKSLSSVYWKFQYDFTTAQANGAIGSMGLTGQYNMYTKTTMEGYTPYSGGTYQTYTSDGRYNYACSTAGIITKYDALTNATETIDVSAIVGTTAASTKLVGYAPATGQYYIFVYNLTTASLRKMYVFSDATFSSLVTTYSTPNTLFDATSPALYIYGGKAYQPVKGSYNRIYIGDFVNNTAITTLNVPEYSNCSNGIASGRYTNNMFLKGTCPVCGTYVAMGLMGNDSTTCKSIIFDLATETVAAYTTPTNYGSTYGFALHPLKTERLVIDSSGRFVAAIAAYKLPVPVTKTSANGMTVTYELEVFY